MAALGGDDVVWLGPASPHDRVSILAEAALDPNGWPTPDFGLADGAHSITPADFQADPMRALEVRRSVVEG